MAYVPLKWYGVTYPYSIRGPTCTPYGAIRGGLERGMSKEAIYHRESIFGLAYVTISPATVLSLMCQGGLASVHVYPTRLARAMHYKGGIEKYTPRIARRLCTTTALHLSGMRNLPRAWRAGCLLLSG